MRIWKIIFPILWILLKGFFKRLLLRYFITDFHPAFLFYLFSFVLFLVDIPFMLSILSKVISYNKISYATLLAFTLLTISALQTLFFAMWIDIQENDRYDKTLD